MGPCRELDSGIPDNLIVLDCQIQRKVLCVSFWYLIRRVWHLCVCKINVLLCVYVCLYVCVKLKFFCMCVYVMYLLEVLLANSLCKCELMFISIAVLSFIRFHEYGQVRFVLVLQ